MNATQVQQYLEQGILPDTIRSFGIVPEAVIQEAIRKKQAAAKVSPAVADQVQATVTETTAPVWETPAHEEIDLATVSPEDLGLDPFDFSDPLVKKIYRAQDANDDPYPKFPEVLKQSKGFVTWKGDVQDKQPYQSGTTIPASYNKSNHLVTYQTALKNILEGKGYPHLGLVPREGRIAFDIDSCRDPLTGQVKQWAIDFIKLFPSTYCEVTPSLTGLRVWAFVPSLAGQRITIYKIDPVLAAVASKAPQIEVLTTRYATITGVPYLNAPSSVAELSEQGYAPIREYLEKLGGGSGGNKKPVDASLDSPEIPRGSRYTELLRIAGLLRGAGMTAEKIYEHLLDILENRCPGYGPEYPEKLKSIAQGIGSKPDGITEALNREQAKIPYVPGSLVVGAGYTQESLDAATKQQQTAKAATAVETIPIVDDPSDHDSRFEMTGETFNTKVYEDVSRRFTAYPEPGDDLISQLAKKLVTGTPIPLAYVREPLKAIVLHAIDGKVIHPAHRGLTMRGNYFSLGESEGGKTTGLEYALRAAGLIFSTCQIHPESLFRYKSEQTFIRSFTPEGTIKRDAQGNIKSGRAGHPSQFLHIKEGNLVANSSDYFAAVFSMLTNLYDQTEAATESMTNGAFDAGTIRTSTVMCFTPSDYAATFGGKGAIGGGGLNRWGLVNPPEDHSYDERDWEPVSDAEIQTVISPLASKVFELRQHDPVVLIEEDGAGKIRLETKAMLKKAGKAGKRLLEYFMREQVAQAVVAADTRLVMTTQQAAYAKRWVEAQVECRLNCWPSDANNQIESMEHAMRKTVNGHFVSETRLKDACNFYREGSGGWFAFNAARNNMMASEAIKLTGKTRKGARLYCPGFCTIHPPVKEDDKSKKM
jgi:hypothetical protein